VLFHVRCWSQSSASSRTFQRMATISINVECFRRLFWFVSTRVDYFRLSITVYCYRLLSIIVDPGVTDWRNCSPKACYVKLLLKGLFAHIIHALIHGFQRWLSFSSEWNRRCTAIRLRCAVLYAACWSVSSAVACTSQTRCYFPIIETVPSLSFIGLFPSGYAVLYHILDAVLFLFRFGLSVYLIENT
jgi:hypothetical protein